MARRLVVLGNGPVAPGLGGSIDAADCVMRFNRPGGEAAGTRADLLMLVNSGKAPGEWLRDQSFLASAHLRQARQVILPFHPATIAAWHPKPNILSWVKGRRADWTFTAIDVLGRAGKEVLVLSPQIYDEACKELGIAERERTRLFPSTGFMGILYALKSYSAPEWQVEISGFGWQGWKRHAWDREKAWVQRQMEDGRLRALNG